MNIKTVYLVLAIVGAVAPYAFFVQHFGMAGFGPAYLYAIAGDSKCGRLT